jgi:hypothetical protein
MNPALYLQQCRIYQNRAKDTVSLPYAENYRFYKTLDGLVQDGRKIKITFGAERITEKSSCWKG